MRVKRVPIIGQILMTTSSINAAGIVFAHVMLTNVLRDLRIYDRAYDKLLSSDRYGPAITDNLSVPTR